MRRVTRDFLLGMGVVLVLLLSLGVLPSYLQSGDPYYLTATPVGEAGNATTAPNATTATAEGGSAGAVNASTLADQRYPYTTEALANATATDAGRSTPYYRGPVGIKGAFTHSPFDEYDSLAQQYPDAVDGDGVRVRQGGTVYRLAVTQQA